MAGPFGFGKRKKEPERPPERELSPEEQLLAEKAREAALKREIERRAQTDDVSNFLEDILGVAETPSESEPEPESEPRGEAEAAALPQPESVIEPDGGHVEPAAPFADEAEDEGKIEAGAEVPAPPVAAPADRADAGKETLSAPLSAAWAGLMALGRPADERLRLAFEPEVEAGIMDRSLAGLSMGRRARRPKLEFEPEADETALDLSAGPDSQSASKTVIMQTLPELEPPEPGTAPTPEPEAGAEPGETADRTASSMSTLYSLDDLPEMPTDSAPAHGGATERLPDDEPLLGEERLDDAGLREALAAAEAASRHSGLPRSMPATAAPEPGTAPGAMDGAPAAPQQPDPVRQYSLDDLPEAPPGTDRQGSSEGTDRSANADDDRLNEEMLPELPAGSAPPAEAGLGQLSALERAVDRAAHEPSGDGAPPVAAESAADLSIRQLADMERYIESQITDAGEAGPAAGAKAGPQRRSAPMFLLKIVQSVRNSLAETLRTADWMLEPYGLNCKRLLGIAGILGWAAIIAFAVRFWVLAG